MLAAGLLIGCAAEDVDPATADKDPTVQDDREAPTAIAAASAVHLQQVDRAKFDEIIRSQAGKVVLVDFWATWCMPCLAQLPHTAELAEAYRDAGLAVFTVSIDEPEDAGQAAQVLASKTDGAGITHLISAVGGGSAAVEAFEISGGSAPHYKLYDRTGKLRQTFGVDPAAERQFTHDDIEAAVKQLLEE